MKLSEQDKAYIKENYKKLPIRRLANDLKVPRSEIQKYISSVSAQTESSARIARTLGEKSGIRLTILCLLILLAENLSIFWRHYFKDTGVGFDFWTVNHAIPYYWITSMQLGLFPQWVPFQAMGYPLQMFPLSSFYYFPFWIFVVFNKTYTLHAAVVFQCLHIFMGATGMFWLCKTFKIESLYSLAAAVAYQLFGGFYYNFGHDVIVRSYCFIPWLLIGLNVSQDESKSIKSVILIPLSTYLLFTGGYTGAGIATLFMGFLFIGFQFLFDYLPSTTLGIKIYLQKTGLFLLGLLCTSVHLLPVWLLKSELARYQDATIQHARLFTWKHFLTMYLPANPSKLSLEPSMQSLFISLPVLSMLLFLSRKTCKQYVPFIALAVTAILISSNHSVYSWVSMILPPLGLSRFPCADYRAFVAIPLIILGAVSLKNMIEEPGSWVLLALKGGVIIVLTYLGAKWLVLPQAQRLAAFSCLGFLLIFLILTKLKAMPSWIILSYFIILTFANGILMHAKNEQWVWDNVTQQYKEDFNSVSDTSGEQYDYDSQFVHAARLKKCLTEKLAFRPERRDPLPMTEYMPGEFFLSWRGYLTGAFMMTDYSSGMSLSRQKKIYKDGLLKDFMLKQSSVLVLPPDDPLSIDSLHQSLSQMEIQSPPEKDVRLKNYSVNGLVYDVNLTSPIILVENETYFPGWTGTLRSSEKVIQKIPASAAGELLRAWRLPEGTYEFTEEFKMPYLKLGAVVSCAAAIIWLAVIGFSLNSKRRDEQQPAKA